MTIPKMSTGNLKDVKMCHHPPLKCRVGVKWVYFYYQAERAVVWHQAGEDTQLEEYMSDI